MRRQGAILAALGWDVWRTTAGAASDAKINQLDCLELLAMLHFRGFVDTDGRGRWRKRALGPRNSR